MNYVGIDHHRQHSHMTMMDQEGQILRSGRNPNCQSEIEMDDSLDVGQDVDRLDGEDGAYARAQRVRVFFGEGAHPRRRLIETSATPIPRGKS